MVIQPRTADEIKSEIVGQLDANILAASNFNDDSFDGVFIEAYAEQVREAELKTLAAQLSGYVRYAGKTDIDRSDLRELGVRNVDPEDIRPYIDESDLDELGRLVGVSRDEGSKSRGQVTFTTTNDTVKIYEGDLVATERKVDGERLVFGVDADGDGEIGDNSDNFVTPDSGSTTITVDVVAQNVGSEYNVGANTLTYLPSPRSGVISVENEISVTGGESRQSSDELREEIQRAVFTNSGGGTERGIEGEIRNDTDSDVVVELVQFTDATPPYVDVVVDGGNENTLREIIDRTHPPGIEHRLVRPTRLRLGVMTEILGNDIDPSTVAGDIEAFLESFEIAEDMSRSVLNRAVLESQNAIKSVMSLTTFIDEVERELFVADGSSVYQLDYAPLGEVDAEQHRYRSGVTDYQLMFDGIDASTVTVDAIVSDDEIELVHGSADDYTIVDTDEDGRNDTVRLTGNTLPDEGTTIRVSYRHDQPSIDTVVDENDTEYVEGTDFTIVDSDSDGANDALDFSTGGSTPSDGDEFFVTYRAYRSFRGDLPVGGRELVRDDSTMINVDTQNAN